MSEAPSIERASAGQLLREVARHYTRAQRIVSDCCGTSSTQCHLLVELSRSGQQPMGELGARLGLEKSWVSRAIDGLVDRGLVDKQANPADARSWLVGLTPRGERCAADLNRSLDAHADAVLAPLAAEQREAVEAALALLLQALQAPTDVAACCAAAIGTPSPCTPNNPENCTC